MIIGILKENETENRVSALADTVSAFIKLKATVWFETGAGTRAFESDDNYTGTGALAKQREEILAGADVLLSINPISYAEVSKVKTGAIIVGVYQPLFNYPVLKEWVEKGVSVFSLDMLPRSTRAQSMDVLSSQANIAGYKAVIMAAGIYPHYFPMFMTAAGTITPAKVLILGAGVAGLQAVATARRLGAVVEVFDTRPAVKEEVMSLGAKFIEVEGAADASKSGGYAVEQTEDYKQKQQQKIGDAIAKADIVITTAQIPGRRAPVLITQQMVNNMKAGSVIIDIAAATGGNCELTKNGETVVYNGISIVGNSNLPASVPADASKLYGKNVLNFLKLMIADDGSLKIDFNDDLIKNTCIVHDKKIVNERIKELAAHN
ncbi:MAG TPA: Re/Si-specific NAD(P)(+) transhydrogenase subunit alpha [Chitinophagales bacterium]|nr:Re/Si-specific NAD(P)(+) transhydrogenase subunit alpha [Chitinophagales bacterium]